MSIVAMHGSVVSIDNPTSPVDISSQVKSWKPNKAKNTGKAFTMDNRYQKTVEGGGLAMDISLEVYRTTGANEGSNIFETWLSQATPASRTLTIDSPNSNSGSRRITGEFSILSITYSREAGSSDPEILTVELTNDGTYSDTTI